jgi:hypothetical protein
VHHLLWNNNQQKMKQLIITIFAVFLLVLPSAHSDILSSLTGNNDKDQIAAVLASCAVIIHNAEPIQNDAYAQATLFSLSYNKLDISKCPKDFQMAFQEHTLAWAARAAHISMGKNEDETDFKEIVKTRLALIKLATKYGAVVPKGF